VKLGHNARVVAPSRRVRNEVPSTSIVALASNEYILSDDCRHSHTFLNTTMWSLRHHAAVFFVPRRYKSTIYCTTNYDDNYLNRICIVIKAHDALIDNHSVLYSRWRRAPLSANDQHGNEGS